MKTIGLIGGTSWESSLEYYRLLNETTKKRLGGLHSAKVLMYSLDFGPMEQAMRSGDWEAVARVLKQGARSLELGGADFFLLCSNTTHKCAGQVAAAVDIPLLHIGRATGLEIQRLEMQSAGLLGTRFVMQEDFLKGYLESNFGLEILTPEPADQDRINSIIFEELCLGRFRDASRCFFQDCINGLKDRGAECVILGCTEIPMLVKAEDACLPSIDTTTLHARTAVDEALVD
ncbi:MAG: aspartate/glutamate racemase family protein [Desulfohalobiaceae bacterium]|nr:aspartate/glutamate racemase family protein [Desulfohalobiaceae bacterium]